MQKCSKSPECRIFIVIDSPFNVLHINSILAQHLFLYQISFKYIILLQGLYQIFFSNQDDPVELFIKVDMERCSKRPECRIYTVIDKKKENSMILCITVNDTPSCFALTCSCQKNRKKRAVNSHVNLDPTKKTILIEKPIPAQCEISIDNRNYFPVKNKPMTATSYFGYSIAPFGFTSKNHSYDNKNFFY